MLNIEESIALRAQAQDIIKETSEMCSRVGQRMDAAAALWFSERSKQVKSWLDVRFDGLPGCRVGSRGPGVTLDVGGCSGKLFNQHGGRICFSLTTQCDVGIFFSPAFTSNAALPTKRPAEELQHRVAVESLTEQVLDESLLAFAKWLRRQPVVAITEETR